MSITSTILVDGLWLTILKEENNDDLSPPTKPDPNLKDHYHTTHTLPASNLMENLLQLNPPPAPNLVKDSILRPQTLRNPFKSVC